LRELLSYDPKTGMFTWRIRSARRVHIGDVAGGVNGRGYLTIRVDGRQYLAHRLAFLHMTGSWPKKEHIDHINMDRADNRWADQVGRNA
jgi:hypothetical protein